MNLLLFFKRTLLVLSFLVFFQHVDAQFLMDMVDTTKEVGKGLLSIYKKFDHLNINAYLQPQFQVAETKGAASFNGGDFAPQSNNRFLIRRGRVRFEYAHFNDNNLPTMQLVMQFEGSERGVAVRDFWARIFENRWQLFSFSAGMFARPFGYEVNLASSDRETPERGRMSQTLMKVERDLGAMVSLEPRKKDHPLRFFKLDVGLFNGQGFSGPSEYDSYKDIISRFSLKPYAIARNLKLSAGISFFQGGLVQSTKYVNRIQSTTAGKQYVVDSSATNVGAEAPRRYRGGDMQLKWKHAWGGVTELRGEYWWGTQSATALTSETPGTLANEPQYVRKFNGAFFYLLQNIFNTRHQLGVKYDWYDPNTDVKGIHIGEGGNNLKPSDIRYDTWSFGYNYYVNVNLKLMLWYDIVKNERTSLPGYTNDLKDNVFTCRLQFRF
ncbi:MAG: porin [Chitinophagaceae bacterium]